MKITKRFSFLLAVAAAIFWGTYGTFTRFMGDMGMETATVSLVSPLFLIIFFFSLVLRDDKRKMKVPAKALPVLIFYGLVSAAFNYSLVKAYTYFPIGIVSTIVYCNLFLLMIFSYFLFKDPLTWKKGLAGVLAVSGIAMVLNVFSLDWSLSLIGIFWTLLALTSWAGMVTCEKYMLLHDVDGNAMLTYSGLFSLVFISILSPPWQSAADLIQSVAATGGLVLLPLLGLGVLTTIGAYYLYLSALRNLEPTYVQLAYIMDPTTASILGFIVFGQELEPIQIGGIILVLLVVIWVQWGERKPSHS